MYVQGWFSWLTSVLSCCLLKYWNTSTPFIYYFLKFIYLFIYLDRGAGRERERNINVWLPLPHPHWGRGPQPRHVPWPGVKPVTLWFAGWHSIHWATPARAPHDLLNSGFPELHVCLPPLCPLSTFPGTLYIRSLHRISPRPCFSAWATCVSQYFQYHLCIQYMACARREVRVTVDWQRSHLYLGQHHWQAMIGYFWMAPTYKDNRRRRVPFLCEVGY